MKSILKEMPVAAFCAVAGIVLAACACSRGAAETLPASTALPVTFTTTIEAGKAKVNEKKFLVAASFPGMSSSPGLSNSIPLRMPRKRLRCYRSSSMR
jgi:hypothetical protein